MIDVFQFNGDGMSAYLKDLVPDNIEDLIATNSIYRPGTMETGGHKKYIEIKHGRMEPEYLFKMEEITKDTYSILIYQEQILKLVQVAAGFTLADADSIRRAIGKKNMDLMKSYRDQFIKGCLDRGAPEGEPEKLWELIEVFAGYSFNRAHAACYAILGYITAYLKAHYPVEFYTTAFQFVKDDKMGKASVARIVSEIHKIGSIKVMPADINNSNFHIVGDHKLKRIYWSLKKIKFVGEVAVKNILKEREEGGNFYSFEEFYIRMQGKKINKKALFNMALCGCFDEIEKVKVPSDRLRIVRKFRDIVKVDLPETFSNGELTRQDYFWSKLAKALTGFGYIDFKKIADRSSLSNLMKYYIDEDEIFSEESENKYVLLSGQFVELKERKSKNGPFCQLELSLNYNNIFCTIWNDKYEEFRQQLTGADGRVVIIYGQIKMDNWKKKNVIYSIEKTKIEII